MSTPIYKVIFQNHSQIYELYARQIFQSEMYGFIEIEEIVFDERSQMIVDPGEEKLKNEFTGVSRSYIPLHALIRIDEVEKKGVSKVSDCKVPGGNIANFPTPSSAKPAE